MIKRLYLQSVSACLFALFFTSCFSCPETGKSTSVGGSDARKYWKLSEVQSGDEGLLFGDKASKIVSRFTLKNFEVSAKIKSSGGASGVIGFHYKGGVSPSGYRVYINNSDYGTGCRQKTGSLCNIRNNYVSTAFEDEWFKLNISVRGNHIKASVNDKVISEYFEPKTPVRRSKFAKMLLSQGKLFVEKVTGEGEIVVGELLVYPLEDDVVACGALDAKEDEVQQVLTLLNQDGFPLIDYHGHLKGGLTAEQARRHGRSHGFNYGIAVNCGLKFPVTRDESLNKYIDSIRDEPVFKAMQCEGREWVTLFSPEAVAKFDYIFTDAMTWTDHKGRRMRLWLPDEVVVEDEQQFMDMLVEKIESILKYEPIDIYVNPTYLPEVIDKDYDRLWTPERIDRVVKALKSNDVALEINARFRLPGIALAKKAKEAGVKFSFGTNNGSNDDLGRLEYCLEVIKEVGIEPDDIFTPRPKNDKKVMVMGIPSEVTG